MEKHLERESCQTTLKDLRLDYLDLYLIHFPQALQVEVPPSSNLWFLDTCWKIAAVLGVGRGGLGAGGWGPRGAEARGLALQDSTGKFSGWDGGAERHWPEKKSKSMDQCGGDHTPWLSLLCLRKLWFLAAQASCNFHSALVLIPCQGLSSQGSSYIMLFQGSILSLTDALGMPFWRGAWVWSCWKLASVQWGNRTLLLLLPESLRDMNSQLSHLLKLNFVPRCMWEINVHGANGGFWMCL